MNDEIQTYRTRSRAKKQSETTVMTKLLTLQLVCGSLIILILFLISKSGGAVSNNISNFYREIHKNDMSIAEVAADFKNATKETFAPVKNAEITTVTDDTGESDNASPDIF